MCTQRLTRMAIRRLTLAAAALVLVAACQQSKHPGVAEQMDWAKDALGRNPSLEVVATDADAGIITVRDRRTGEVHAVALSDLAAVPVAQLSTPAPAPAPGAESAVGPGGTAYVPGATSQSAAEAASGAQAVSTLEQAAPAATEATDYTIERSNGHVKISGPGVSIVSGGAAPVASARGEPGQRAVDPIICEGRRVMHLDGRDIYVEGDAITVRDGCELYLTNSRVVASSTGVVVRGGVVHIANSYVEGGVASFDAETDAKMYVQGTTFQGLTRRNQLAMIEDQGGNRGLPAL